MTNDGAADSTQEPLRALSDDLRSLVQQELRQAQDELAGKARRTAKAAALFGGAGVMAALATGSTAMLLTRVLERFLPPATAAAVTVALYGCGAGVLAGAGMGELRRARPFVPRDTVEQLRQDTRAMSHQRSAR